MEKERKIKMNEEEFRQKKFMNYKLFLASMIIIVTIALSIFLIILFNQNIKCNKNPFVYGASEFAEDYEGDVVCNCYINGEGGYKEFSFTDKEFNPTRTRIVVNVSDLQF